jgi:DNA polymerase III sliding clamp (beta) subunit (PCNA family)
MNNYNYDRLLQYRNEIDELTKSENPDEIMVQRRTAFICLENAKLTIKELNGDIKEYDIIIPKTPEQIENEELKKKIAELESKLAERGKE